MADICFSSGGGGARQGRIEDFAQGYARFLSKVNYSLRKKCVFNNYQGT